MFAPGKTFAQMGRKNLRARGGSDAGPEAAACAGAIEQIRPFQCKDCGDCSLPDIAFLCPESQCAKNQRNGPCGGTREGRCEVDGYRRLHLAARLRALEIGWQGGGICSTMRP